MIVPNGTIQAMTKTGGGFLHGKPIPVTETAGPVIPARIVTNKYDHAGKTVDGVFTQYAFYVLIDTDSFNAERITITRSNKQLGTFRVQDIEFLDAVQTIKISV